ncbi:hypothetical protein JCM1841_004576 [Sporobolomyces salmonicolor]
MSAPTALVWSTVSLAALSAYSLAPATPPICVAVLIAAVTLILKLLLSTRLHVHSGAAAELAALFLALLTGSTIAFACSNPHLGSIVSGADSLIGLLLYSTFVCLVPLLGLLLGELVASSFPASCPASAILFSTLCFVASGLVQEQLGAGRALWWIRHADAELDWAATYGGPPLVDCLYAMGGIALAQIIFLAMDTNAQGEAINLLSEPAELPVQTSLSPETTATQLPRLRKPIAVLAFALCLLFVSPILRTPAFDHAHPSPQDPSYRYPPLKVGCVVPPAQPRQHHKDEPRSKLDDWLHETKVVAGRGAKVVSWSEGALRLDGKGRKEKQEGEGWEAMGKEEQEVLKRVAEVCDMYKIYVHAAYLVPAPDAPRHKLLNVATLVGPSSSPSSTAINVVWSTTKHHPVPFVESYSYATRLDRSLGSSANQLPLSHSELSRAAHTPAPHLTPLQTVDITGAICQDVAFPSLLSSFVRPSSSSSSSPSSSSGPQTPQLILNPSYTPILSLARAQFAQVRARAVEQNAFVLRCDAAEGASGLVGPDGDARVLRSADEVTGSWEAELDAERATEATGFTSVWFGDAVGAEWAVVGWLAGVVVLVAAGESGAVTRRRMKLALEGGWRKVKEAARWTTRTEARLVAAEAERLLDDDEENGDGEARLVNAE